MMQPANTAAGINRTMSIGEWLMLITLSILWGGSFFFVEVIIDAVPPLTTVLLRVGLAAAALWCVAAALRLPFPTAPAAWGAFLIMGGLNNVLPFSLITWGQLHITSGLASIYNATMPIFTVLIAGALLADERMTAAKSIGVAAGFAGVVVLIGPSALAGIGTDVVAQAAVLAAAVSYGFASVFGRRFKRMGLPPIVVAAGQVSGSTLLLAPAALWWETPPAITSLSAAVVLSLLGLALLSTALAYILYFRILSSAGATNLSLVTFLVPLSAIALGIAFLDEPLHAQHIAGMLCIMFGLAAIDGRLWAWLKARYNKRR